MKLTSNWEQGKLFWRMFTKDDTTYTWGWKEGLLSNGESANLEYPTGFFQLEIKKDGVFGKMLMAAGHVFNNSDGDFVFTNSGQLVNTVQAAAVVIDKPPKTEPYGRITQFFLGGSSDVTIKIVSSLSQTTTITNNHQSTINNSAENEVGGEVGAETSVKGEYDDIEYGVKVNGNLSEKVINKIGRTVATELAVEVATTTSYSEEHAITLKAGRLTAVTTSWQRRFVTGTVTILQDSFSFEATLGYFSSINWPDYASADDLPPELIIEYMKQNPGYVSPGGKQLQSDWRWCHKCQGLFFSNGETSVGTCPAGGQHEKTNSWNYALAHNFPVVSGQSDWRYCHKCQGLFFSGGEESAGNCPAGGQHEKGVSWDYSLPHNSPSVTGQSDWRYCHKCQGLFFASGHSLVGSCPAGDQHDKGESWNYTLTHIPNP